MTDVPAALAEAADHVAVTRLQQAYADAVTRRDWAVLDDLFLPDAVVELDLITRPPREIVGPAALGAFIAEAIERFDFFQFVVLTSHVTLWPDGDRDAATARIFMCELRRERGGQERGEAFGRYQDRYARVGGRWWFAARAYRSMARWPGGEVFPLPPG